MDDNVAAEVEKGELKIIETLLSRGRRAGGLIVTVRTMPMVEEFFKSLGDGTAREVRLSGRHWFPTNDTKPLMAYDLQPSGNPGTVIGDDGNPCRIDVLGQPLMIAVQEDPHGDGGGRVVQPSVVTNLSFLRLIGSSEGAGVSFIVKGVFSLEELNRINARIGDAQRKLYNSFMKPVEMVVQISTQRYFPSVRQEPTVPRQDTEHM